MPDVAADCTPQAINDCVHKVTKPVPSTDEGLDELCGLVRFLQCDSFIICNIAATAWGDYKLSVRPGVRTLTIAFLQLIDRFSPNLLQK